MLPLNEPAEAALAGSERILIHAPFGRDAELIRHELRIAGFAAEICRNVESLCSSIHDGAGAALVGDEALTPPAIALLAAQLTGQPLWSDFPLLVMTSGGGTTDSSRFRLRLLVPLGNIELIERPLRPATLVSSLKAALRARRHQYQIRSLLGELADTNNELKIANVNLIRMNRELEEFAWVASHDLKEPMRMINIYTQLILRNIGEAPELSRYADFVREGVNRMEALLADLLMFSRTIHAGRAPDQVADLSASLDEAVAVLQGRIAENAAVINAQPLPRVRGDARQLSLVFQNLISNSIKYRRPVEPPEIDIAAEAVNGQWVVSVRDNGIGFDQQYAERIFGLFKRLHKDEYPGTGLGLSICQRIVERYGGRMWAKGNAGEGAVFYFALQPAA